MKEQLEFNDYFMKGYNYFLYESDEETRIAPIEDNSDINKLGYYYGYTYGEQCEMMGMANVINQENLLAVMDKYYTIAYNKLQQDSKHI